MVLKKRNQNNIFAITVSPMHITLTCPQGTHVVSASNLVGPDLVILNITLFKKNIIDFLSLYGLSKPTTAIALEGYSVQELIADEQFMPQREYQHLVWQGMPLSHQFRPTVYFCALGQELIFHYQLLATSCQLALISLTTCTMAQLNSYGMALSCSSIYELKETLKTIPASSATLKLAAGTL